MIGQKFGDTALRTTSCGLMRVIILMGVSADESVYCIDGALISIKGLKEFFGWLQLPGLYTK